MLNFRRLLEPHGPAEAIFTRVNAGLAAQRLLVKTGTVVDATILAAPISTKNQTAQCDPEMSSTQNGADWHFRTKAPIGYGSHAFTVPTHGGEEVIAGERAYADQVLTANCRQAGLPTSSTIKPTATSRLRPATPSQPPEVEPGRQGRVCLPHPQTRLRPRLRPIPRPRRAHPPAPLALRSLPSRPSPQNPAHRRLNRAGSDHNRLNSSFRLTGHPAFPAPSFLPSEKNSHPLTHRVQSRVFQRFLNTVLSRALEPTETAFSPERFLNHSDPRTISCPRETTLRSLPCRPQS